MPEATLRSEPTIKPSGSLPAFQAGSGDHATLDPRRWLALVVILGAAFLGVLDFFVVNIAFPSIKHGLDATDAQIQLMIAFYGQGYAVCLITGGRLGDIFGRKRMFILGMSGFTLASTLCGLAPTAEALIAARIMQGVTGALMFPQVLAIIQVMFPPRERHIAFGIFGAVLGTASFAGNLLGGLVIERWGWRPVFLINLPLGVFAITTTIWLLRESQAAKAVRLDLGGVALATAVLGLLIYPLIQGRELGWPAWTFVCMAASVPMAGVFLVYEKWVTARGGFPLVDLGLFHDRVFVLGLAVTLAVYGAMAMFFLTFTVFLQEGMRFSPTRTGWIFAPFAIGFLVSSTVAVRLTARLGSRIINIGLLLMMTGIAIAVTLANQRGIRIDSTEIMSLLVIYGIGQGLTTPTLLSVVLSGIPTRAAGSASGVLTTVQQIAQGIGVAAIGTIFFGILGPDPAPETYPGALATALTCNAVLLALGFGLMLLLPRKTGHTEVRAVEI